MYLFENTPQALATQCDVFEAVIIIMPTNFKAKAHIMQWFIEVDLITVTKCNTSYTRGSKPVLAWHILPN